MVKERDKKHDEIDLIELFKSALAHWRWFVVSVTACVVVAGTYLAFSTPVYQRKANILLKSEGGGLSANLAALGNMAGMLGMGGIRAGGMNIDNEIVILKSHHLVGQVVAKLGLDVKYTQRGKELYGRLPLRIAFTEDAEIGARLKAELLDEGRVRLFAFERRSYPEEKFADECFAAIGDTISTPLGRIALIPATPAPKSTPVEGVFAIAKGGLNGTTQGYQTLISVAPVDKKSSILSISTRSAVPQKAEEIVNTLIDAYGADGRRYKQDQARITGSFIDERIDSITAELSAMDTRIEAFKKDNQIFDPTVEVQLWAQESAEYRAEGLSVEGQIEMTKFLKDFLRERKNDLIPAMIAVESPSISVQIADYNTAMLEYNKITSGGAVNNPVAQTLETQLGETRRSILSSLDSHIKTLGLQQRTLQREESKLQKRILDLPTQEREALELVRQQKIKQEIYLYLLGKREESAIDQHNNEESFRVIDRAYGPLRPVAPRKMLILAISILLGGLIPFGVLFLKKA